jgi:hypothetical protein
MSDQEPGPSIVYTDQILDQPVFELNPLNFLLFFFDFPPAKSVLSTRSSKSPEFYPKKYFQKTKRVQLYIYKKRVTLPVSTADPQKVDKVDFDFCQKKIDFCVRLLDAVRKFERLIVQK